MVDPIQIEKTRTLKTGLIPLLQFWYLHLWQDLYGGGYYLQKLGVLP